MELHITPNNCFGECGGVEVVPKVTPQVVLYNIAEYFFYCIAGLLNGIVVNRDTKCQKGGYKVLKGRIVHLLSQLYARHQQRVLCSKIVR